MYYNTVYEIYILLTLIFVKMKQVRIHVDKSGRLLLPTKIRNQFNIKSGDVFIMEAMNDEIKLTSLNKSIKNIQNLFRQYVPENTPVVDQLLESRAIDLEQEVNSLNRNK